jgi:hypothetical protein
MDNGLKAMCRRARAVGIIPTVLKSDPLPSASRRRLRRLLIIRYEAVIVKKIPHPEEARSAVSKDRP